MKLKWKKSFIYGATVVFALATAYLIAYAFWHKEKSDLIYLIFNSYALVAVLLGLAFALYWKRTQRKKAQSRQRRLNHMVKNLTSPAMLWDDALQTVIINDNLLAITELDAREEGFDPKFLVPWLFGKTDITEADIKEIVTAKNKEYAFIAKKGTPHDFIWNTSAIDTDEDGTTIFLTIGLDLADIRTMQSEIQNYSRRLAASEGKHTLSMELTEIGILLGEQGSRTVFPSPELQKILGFQSNAIDIDELRNHVYPADQVMFDNHINAVQTNMEQFLGDVNVMELRLCDAKGRYRWFCYRFKAARGENGQMVIGGALLDITKEKEKDAKIEQLAYEDTATGIPNRNKLMLVGEELYQCTVEIGSSYWVIVLDIDRFHLINDTCGYENGTLLLKNFAASVMRQLNLGGFGARIGGNNFALILRNSDENLPVRVAQKLQKELASQAVGPFANRTLTCSVGYALMPRDAESFEKVLEKAQFALTNGKKDASASITGYNKAMFESVLREKECESELINAIRQGQFLLHYQPKISLKTGSVVGLEALVRWQRPDGTLVMPGEFIPIAEKSQLITHITRFVLYEACRQTRQWQKIGLPPITMSFNMSSTDFYQENLVEQVLNALEKNDLDPEFLEIELTEELALKDVEMAIEQMERLRDVGIKIALDDFGTGYSSLSYIQKLPVTSLKFDRTLIKQLTTEPIIPKMVAALGEIAASKQVATLAEGVETAEQAKMLLTLGCEQIQGNLSAKPMPPHEAELFIRKNWQTPFAI